MEWKHYGVWVPAGADGEKDICRAIMTSIGCHEARMEGNPFGNYLDCYAEPEYFRKLIENYPEIDWKELPTE